jgi:putative Holliday junction resolvase
MAVDYGDVRTGVAFSDLTKTIAGEALVITERNQTALCAKLLELARSREVDTIVLGYPLNMDDTKNARTEKVEKLERLLKRSTAYSVVHFDERLTTVDAYAILRQNGKSAKKGRATVDALAASLILEGYLNM